MKYIQLPGTEWQASRIVLGTAWFGTTISESESFRLMDVYVEKGGNFLDTAHMYANWVPGGAGKSETTIGKWLKGAARDRVRVATKGADKAMTRDDIRSQLLESMDRLGMNGPDFYWLHVDDPKVPAGEIIEWLNELADEGRISVFGCSNWKIDRIRQAQEYAQQRRLRGFSASQIAWSLARANPTVASGGSQIFMDDDTFAYHCETGFPVVGYSAQAGGFFAGNYDPEGAPPGAKPNPNIVKYYGTKTNYARLAAAKRLAASKGCTSNQIALAYLLHQSFPSLAIVGANTSTRMIDSCGAADVSLTEKEVRVLEEGEGC